MTTITTKDGPQIYYKDWGEGQPVVFSHERATEGLQRRAARHVLDPQGPGQRGWDQMLTKRVRFDPISVSI